MHFMFEDKEIQSLFLVLKPISSVVLVHEQPLQTERPPLVGEVSANFCG
jgi:hypothetical protein